MEEGFRTAAQADSFRSALLTAARQRRGLQPRYRQADSLGADEGRHHLVRVRLRVRGHEVEAGFRQVPEGHRPGADRGDARDAGRRRAGGPTMRASAGRSLRWGFNTKQRSEPPDDVAEVLAWVAGTALRCRRWPNAAIARRMLDQATGRLDGKNAAASTARRHRTILANAMDYAVELGLLEIEPDPGDQVDGAQGVQPGGPAQRREPAPGPGAAGGSACPAAERTAAGRLLRGDVLRRAPSRGSDQPQQGQRDLAASWPAERRLGRTAHSQRDARCG